MKKIFLVVGTFGILLLAWYLFIRSYDFRVNFELNTYPGTINQLVKTWGSKQKNAEVVEQQSLNSFVQEIRVDGSHYTFEWRIKMHGDSTSKVSVLISEPSKSISNRIAMPFAETKLETDAQKVLKEFYKIAKEHLSLIKVTINGQTKLDSTFCVYAPLKTTQIGKAQGMMSTYSMLSSFVHENKLKPTGQPFVDVVEWNLERDSIKYDFCYPITLADTLPSHKLLKYKWLKPTKAIKAIYNGNYITSDRAWYALMHYADRNNLITSLNPIEIYYNNPNFDRDDTKWRADIFLPIK